MAGAELAIGVAWEPGRGDNARGFFTLLGSAGPAIGLEGQVQFGFSKAPVSQTAGQSLGVVGALALGAGLDGGVQWGLNGGAVGGPPTYTVGVAVGGGANVSFVYGGTWFFN